MKRYAVRGVLEELADPASRGTPIEKWRKAGKEFGPWYTTAPSRAYAKLEMENAKLPALNAQIGPHQRVRLVARVISDEEYAKETGQIPMLFPAKESNDG